MIAISTQVELKGMTINLVEDKATYEAMQKNLNEMYLVQNDYDMVIELNEIIGASAPIARIASGSYQDLLGKIESSSKHPPKVLVEGTVYYGTALTKVKEVVSPTVVYYSDRTQINVIFDWIFPWSRGYVWFASDTNIDFHMQWLETL